MSPQPPRLSLGSDLELRALVPGDAATMHALIAANREHLDQWLRWSAALQQVEQVEAFIKEASDRSARGDGFHLGLWERDTLLGGCVCWFIHRHHRNAEIGYWLGSGALGRGLATAASRAVINHLFTVEQLHRIEMQCAVDNLRSRAIPQRLGFRLEGVRRESHWITSRFLDHAVYGLLTTEWTGGSHRPG